MSKLQFTCDYCGNIAERDTNKTRYKHSYCSHKCYAKASAKWTESDAQFAIDNLKQLGYYKLAEHFSVRVRTIMTQCKKWRNAGFKVPSMRIKYKIGKIVTNSNGDRITTKIKTADGWKFVKSVMKVKKPRPKGVKYKKSAPKPKVKKLPTEKLKKVSTPRKQVKKPPVQILSRSQDYSTYTSVKLNSKTTILVRPGTDIEKAKLLYAK